MQNEYSFVGALWRNNHVAMVLPWLKTMALYGLDGSEDWHAAEYVDGRRVVVLRRGDDAFVMGHEGGEA